MLGMPTLNSMQQYHSTSQLASVASMYPTDAGLCHVQQRAISAVKSPLKAYLFGGSLFFLSWRLRTRTTLEWMAALTQ